MAKNWTEVPGDVCASSEYGLMVDGALADAGSDVHIWVLRGANTALVYSALLVLLSLTTSLHVDAGMKFSFLWDFLEASAMAFYKAPGMLNTVSGRPYKTYLIRSDFCQNL